MTRPCWPSSSPFRPPRRRPPSGSRAAAVRARQHEPGAKRPDEAARLAGLNGIAAERLTAAGFVMVDPAPVEGQLAGISSLRGCNGCEVSLGRELAPITSPSVGCRRSAT